MTLSVSLVKALGGGWEVGTDVSSSAGQPPANPQPNESKEAMAPAR
jgi:outer membrane protein, multidrug efflux system